MIKGEIEKYLIVYQELTTDILAAGEFCYKFLYTFVSGKVLIDLVYDSFSLSAKGSVAAHKTFPSGEVKKFNSMG